MVPRSLRTRLVALFSIGTAVALVACLLALYVVLDHRLRSALDDDLGIRSEDLVASVGAGNVDIVATDPFAQLYAADGTLLAGSPSLAGDRLLDPAQVRRISGPTLDTRQVQGVRPLRVRMLSRRVAATGQVLTVAVPTRAVDRASTDALVLLALAAPLLVAALAVAGWLVVRAALHPVDVLRREAAEISTLDADRRLPAVSGDDEIARLAGTLDAMLGRLHVSFARERAFVDDASHELRTPIAVLRGELDLALAALEDSDLSEVGQSVRAAHGQVLRLSRLAEDLLLLAREREGTLVVSREPVDLLAVAEEEAHRLAPVFGVAVEVTGDVAIADADPDRVRQVLANLAANSAAAGARRIAVGVGPGGAGGRRPPMPGTERRPAAAAIEWADDGPGFPPDLLDSAFERFVRGDPARASDGGAGLGLSIVRAIVAAHGGRVAVRNGPPLGGAVVIVEFPPD